MENKFYLRKIIWLKKPQLNYFLHCNKFVCLFKENRVQSLTIQLGYFRYWALFPPITTISQPCLAYYWSSRNICWIRANNSITLTVFYAVFYILTHLILSIARLRQALLLYINVTEEESEAQKDKAQGHMIHKWWSLAEKPMLLTAMLCHF